MPSLFKNYLADSQLKHIHSTVLILTVPVHFIPLLCFSIPFSSLPPFLPLFSRSLIKICGISLGFWPNGWFSYLSKYGFSVQTSLQLPHFPSSGKEGMGKCFLRVRSVSIQEPYLFILFLPCYTGVVKHSRI